jgi:cephalosporin hydroxylase
MEFEDKIFKKSNLEFNDSISSYNGWGAQQNPNTFKVFFDFFKEVQPTVVFEIGTAIGGFTMYLSYICNKLELNTEIFSFDIVDRKAYRELSNAGINIVIEDIFLNEYTDITDKYKSILNKPGPVVVLCDGGNKKLEFNLLSKFLKKGDYILAHDYAYDRSTFDDVIDRKLWNWYEINEDDIKQACIDNSLVDFNREEFSKAVWVCKVKK